jgi:membrane associated rhomboid family serine protease
LHSAGLVLTNLGQEARFHYAAHLVGLIVGGLLVAAAVSRATARTPASRPVDDQPALPGASA